MSYEYKTDSQQKEDLIQDLYILIEKMKKDVDKLQHLKDKSGAFILTCGEKK